MNEFTIRWFITGAACAGALAAAGARLGTLTNWVFLAIWLGFSNAAPRPLLLQLRTKHILWLLLAALGGLNTLLFLTLNFWSPAMIPPAPLPLALALIGATACSWAASSRFRARDGRWHWITYHGQVHQTA